MKDKPTTHCGLCQIEVKNWKIHEKGALHRRNLERAGRGEFGVASGMVANKILVKKSMDRMDEAFNELRKGVSGEETVEIVRKAEEKRKHKEEEDAK